MDLRDRKRLAIPIAIVVGVAAGAAVAGLSLTEASSGPAASPDCCPEGTPCAQPIPLLLGAPNGTFPVASPRTVNFTVLSANTALTAGDLEFLPEVGQELDTSAPLTITVRAENGTAVATYNSTISGWTGQYTGEFGGWITGGAVNFTDGGVFSVTFTSAASWLYGFGFLGCNSRLVGFQFE